MTHQALFNIQEYLQVPVADLRLNQYKLGEMAMVGARLSPVAMIYRVDTTQGLAVNQWLKEQMGSLGQEEFDSKVINREQRLKVINSISTPTACNHLFSF